MRAVLFPQAFTATTEIFPLVVLDVALIEVEVEVPDHPLGNVQVYEVAVVTGFIEYTLVELKQIGVLPEMTAG